MMKESPSDELGFRRFVLSLVQASDLIGSDKFHACNGIRATKKKKKFLELLLGVNESSVLWLLKPQ